MKYSKLQIFAWLSLLFFLIKGIQYSIIGSYVPLIFILFIVITLFWSFATNFKTYLRVLKIWGILIIIWGIARLSLWLIFKIDSSLTESHIREQFGIFQHMISILMIVLGIMISRELKNKKPSGNNVYN